MKRISIIVPVYNVEKYLVKCVESIKRQTYTNLEIILVDDGSTDKCPMLCDNLSSSDKRIQVIHKTNGGLSDARNAGLDISTGDYIGFVDSDDSIENDFYEILVNNLEKYDADISCCRYSNVWDDGTKEPIGDDGTITCYSGIDGLKEYLYGKSIDPFVCNKLFKAEIIGNKDYKDEKHRFIKGIIGEDNPFCIELFKNAKKTVVAGEAKYNYLQTRKGAISSNKKISKKHTIDPVLFWDSVRVDCQNNYPELEKYALRREVLFYIGLYNKIYGVTEYKEYADKVRSFIIEHLEEIKHSDICEKTIKISAQTLALSPFIYRFIMIGYKKFVGRARL